MMNKIRCRKMNKQGFTLAELLIVVAIIAVLVAIAIPVFTTRLEHAKETTDMANLRNAYAAAQTACLTDKIADGSYYFDPTGGAATTGAAAGTGAGTGLAAAAAKSEGMKIGQGTKTDGGAKSKALPAIVTYSNGTDYRENYIKITIADGQCTKIEFEAPSA